MTYSRFVILSYPRCGTHMLRSALASHPHIKCFGEEFNPDRALHRQASVDEILDRRIFTSYSSSIKAVGFVLHATHNRHPSDSWHGVWDSLKELNDLKIIYLQRKNLLARYLSALMADRTNKWERWQSESDTEYLREIKTKSLLSRTRFTNLDMDWQTPLVLRPEEVIADFKKTLKYFERVEDEFDQHSSHLITYESMVCSFQESADAVLRFLDVPSKRIIPATVKQETRPLQNAIANYDGVVEHLAIAGMKGYAHG